MVIFTDSISLLALTGTMRKPLAEPDAIWDPSGTFTWNFSFEWFAVTTVDSARLDGKTG
jgi:hypothetical protein